MPQAVTLIFVAKRPIIDVYGSPGFTTVTLHLLKCAKIQNRNIGYILFVLSSFCSFLAPTTFVKAGDRLKVIKHFLEFALIVAYM